MRSPTAIALSLLAMGLTALPALAQSKSQELFVAAAESMSRERLVRHAATITSWERPSGSDGENAAIDYIAETLEMEGVPFEVLEFMGYTSDPISARVTVPGTDFDPDAITMAFSGATAGIEGVAYDIGTLSDIPELELGTGERLVLKPGQDLPDVRGRVVVVTGQPRNVPTAALEALGAAAIVFINPEERLNDLIVTSTWGTPSLMSEHRLPTIPVAQIRWSDGNRLREMMVAGDVTLRVETEVSQGWVPLRLPVAWIMPEEADETTPYALLGGHIDGWYFAGTDEGASNAAMLEMAIALQQNRHLMQRGLVVAWWPGHSNARYGGSTWFADNFYDDLRQRGIAYLNIDGVGQIDAVNFSVSASPALATLGVMTVEGFIGVPPRVSRPGRNSDQAFNGTGMPLLQFNHTRLAEDGGYWWWHTPDDTYDKIDFDVLEQDAALYLMAISRLVGDDWVPLDLRREIDTLGSALQQRQRESGGHLDLSDELAGVAALGDALREMSSAAAGAGASLELDLAAQAILRPIHRIMFVPGSDHHPDPGIYGGALPGLEPARILSEEEPTTDRFRFAQAQLHRERNRIMEAIDEALHAVEDFQRIARRLVG